MLAADLLTRSNLNHYLFICNKVDIQIERAAETNFLKTKMFHFIFISLAGLAESSHFCRR